MISRLTYILLVTLLSIMPVQAENQQGFYTVELKYIDTESAVSVIRSLLSKETKITAEKNVLIISGNPADIKKVTHVLKEIDQLPTPLTIQFIASSRNLNLNSQDRTYSSNKSQKSAQSMAIIERQWVTLNTGLSIPIATRIKNPDGTESQTFRYKEVNKRYVFKVHEFSGWTIVQVGLDSAELMGPTTIINKNLETTIVGKTGEWLQVAGSTPINKSNEKVYSTSPRDDKVIHLYVRVVKDQESKTNEQ